MGPRLPILTTERLIIRPFLMQDLDEIHRILDLETEVDTKTLEERRSWLAWSVRNYVELERLYQPPYGDRAIQLKKENCLVGSIGLVPLLMPFGLLPSFASQLPSGAPARYTAEVGMFWALENAARGRGYATEAAQALVDYAFGEMNLARLLATTDYDNLPSQRVMERLGMRIETNPYPEPEWFQVVGILENTSPTHQ